MSASNRNEHDEHQNHKQSDHDHSDHDHASHHAHMVKDFKRRFFVSLILTLPVAFYSPMLRSLLGFEGFAAFPGQLYLVFGVSVVLFFYGGYPFLKGLFDEVGQKQPGMMTLIGLAISVAFIYSSLVVFGLKGKVFFWELAGLIDVMLLGHWIEMRSVMSASGALQELAKLMPKEAHRVKDDGGTEDVPVEELAKDDRILIKPGEKIPADGEIVEGETSVNESMITGESTPVAKEPGNEVVGGSVNGEGSLTVAVKSTGKDSYLNRVVELVRKAQESKSKAQGLADKAAAWLTYIALTAGALTMAGWLIFSGKDFVFALQRTVTVMVITCPHALGLAVPLVVAVSTALAAKRGFLIRNRTPFESARKVSAVVFDKTGTLTKGTFKVTEVVTFSDMDEDRLKDLAGAVEARSEHPIAQAVAAARSKELKAEDFESIPGKGAKARVDGMEITVLSPNAVHERDISFPQDKVDSLTDQGQTLIFVLADGKAVGAVGLEDEIREESKQAVDRLKNQGMDVMMLTGDNEPAARRVAEALGLDDYFSEVRPEDKEKKIKEIQESGKTVAMTGDGVNDAPALARADVGIAVGAGTDTAVETADVVLVKSNPLDVAAVIELSKETHKKTVQNLFWATGYNAFAIPLAAGVLYWAGILLSPALGAALMSVSTVVVAINAKIMKDPKIEAA